MVWIVDELGLLNVVNERCVQDKVKLTDALT
jgi:hypothetical protein